MPRPIVAVKKAVETLPEGGVLEIKADAGAFTSDLPVWCKSYGLEMLSITKNGRVVDARIRKGGTAAVQTAKAAAVTVKRANIVLFSGDLDKAMAAFIIATGFATLGHEVSIFCTFWGLNALRKDDPPQVEKDFLSWIFGFMMPCGAKKLALSKMNMLGLGTAMMKNVMAMKNVDDLPTLIKNAREMGVKLLACEMAMNVMGIHKEELLDGVEVAGVANFAGLAEQGGPTLFI
jgi:peroxiredoxin family protein/TusA-related sulfurtransferase